MIITGENTGWFSKDIRQEDLEMNVKSAFNRYKLQIVNGMIYDPIRNITVKATPEEIVRQKTIKYLIKRIVVPQNKIVVERTLHTLGVKGVKRRIDIAVYDEEGLVIAVVECKANLSRKAEDACVQAHDYLLNLGTR